MILVDAGPLVAILSADDRHHERCVTTLHTLTDSMGTVWPAFAEAI